MTTPLDAPAFRAQFPALTRWVWFDTPGSPPAAAPVASAVEETLAAWTRGDFAWRDWDASVETARDGFAALAGVDPARVGALGSVAEGMSGIARSLPPGSVVVGRDEYRSVLYPLLALDPERNPVIRVAGADGPPTEDELLAAVRDDTVLIAASDTLTSSGRRVDFGRLQQHAVARGIRIAADLTQSYGVLAHDLDALDLDYVLVHGYKWLLCPRGAAWIVLGRAAAVPAPLLPSWKSTDPPYGYFGGELDLPSTASRLDTSPAWFSWIGAVAALDLIRSLDRDRVERHCLALAGRLVETLEERGWSALAPAAARSHIVVLQHPREAPSAVELADLGIRVTTTGGRVRIGIHYFNDDDDIDRLIAALGDGTARRSSS